MGTALFLMVVRFSRGKKANADRDIGEWNAFEITMKGDRLTVVLNGVTVLDDCYNANPASMSDAIDAFNGSVRADLPRIYVLGCMEELGDEAPLYNRPFVEPAMLPVIRAQDVKAPLPIPDALVNLIGSPDMCSRRWVWEQQLLQRHV